MNLLKIILIFNDKSCGFLRKYNLNSTSKFLDFNNLSDKARRYFGSSLGIETKKFIKKVGLSLIGFNLFLVIINFCLINS